MSFSHDIAGGQGNLIVTSIQSPNFVAGEQGWCIFKNGDAEFNEIILPSGQGVSVFFSGTAPVTTHVGDLWYDTANGLALSRWNGVAWQSYQIGGAAIQAAAITNLQIALATITGANIASGTITGTNIEGDTITGDLLVSDAIDGFTINGVTINGDTINAADINITSGAGNAILVYGAV